MKYLFLSIFIITVTVFIILPSTACANLLLNPGFEDTAGGQPASWEFTGINPYAQGYSSSTYAHSGNMSIYTSLNATSSINGDWSQRVTGIKAGDLLDANCWAIITAQYAPGYMSTRLNLTFQQWNEGSHSYTDIAYVNSDTINVMQDWAKLSISALAPEGADAVLFRLNGNAFRGGAAAYDDAELSIVPEPASILMLGMGLIGLLVFKKRGIDNA